MKSSLLNHPVVLNCHQFKNKTELHFAEGLIEHSARQVINQYPSLKDKIDAVLIINILGKCTNSPATYLSTKLNLNAKEHYLTTVGGNSVQMSINYLATRIQKGEIRAALIAGAEAFHSSKVHSKTGELPNYSLPQLQASDTSIGIDKLGLNDLEIASGLTLPIHVYPLFETAIAKEKRHTLSEERATDSKIYSRLSEIAASHPYSWFNKPKTAFEIATASPKNRMIAEPYTKDMCAYIQVDQAASMVISSFEVANQLKVKSPVFINAGADLNDVFYFSQRPEYHFSPALRNIRTALQEDLDNFSPDLIDFYSCFPSAIHIATEAFQIDPLKRDISVTGGLSMFGGPGNNYVAHAIATSHQLITTGQAKSGLITALGWYNTKHSVGIYSCEPRQGGFYYPNLLEEQIQINASELELFDGQGSTLWVKGASIQYDRDGRIEKVVCLLENSDKKRTILSLKEEEVEALNFDDLINSPAKKIVDKNEFVLL